MFIKSITIKNFKAIGQKLGPINFCIPDGKTPGSGMNVFVGENNSGKSSIFEAIKFLRDGLPQGKVIEDLKNKKIKDDIEVTMVFSGEIKKVISAFAQSNKGEALANLVFIDGEETLIIQRTSKIEKKKGKKQDSKEKEIAHVEQIDVWNNEGEGSFENPSGIDAPIKKIFEANYIWADTSPEDVTKFGASTICGKLLKAIMLGLEETNEYKEYKVAHNKAFNDDKFGLKKRLDDIRSRTREIFQEQFGVIDDLFFHFDEVGLDNLFKNVRIKVKQNGIDTYLDENGTGMQRSVALALLQVYAERLSIDPASSDTKPFFLFIDEPEVCLHPQAQEKLFLALNKIAQTQQVFIISHSPFFTPVSSIGNIYTFRKSDKETIAFFHSQNQDLIKHLRDERNFFLRHRNLFFSKKAIFVEGVEDFERYVRFCLNVKLPDSSSNIFILNGAGNLESLKSFCEEYGIIFSAIVDVDYLEKNEDTLNELKNIEGFNDTEPDSKPRKQWYRDNEEEVFKIRAKYFQALADKGIFLTHKPDVKDVLNSDGTIINVTQIEPMLREIFS